MHIYQIKFSKEQMTKTGNILDMNNELMTELDRILLSLNGFLNGYSDKLSNSKFTVTNIHLAMPRKQSIKIDQFEYCKARDRIESGYKNPYEFYENFKKEKRIKLRQIKHKVNDFLTKKDVLDAYKKNIKN